MAFAKMKPNVGGGAASALFKPKGTNKVAPTNDSIFENTGFDSTTNQAGIKLNKNNLETKDSDGK